MIALPVEVVLSASVLGLTLACVFAVLVIFLAIAAFNLGLCMLYCAIDRGSNCCRCCCCCCRCRRGRSRSTTDNDLRVSCNKAEEASRDACASSMVYNEIYALNKASQNSIVIVNGRRERLKMQPNNAYSIPRPVLDHTYESVRVV